MKRIAIAAAAIVLGWQYGYSRAPELNGTMQPVIQQLKGAPSTLAEPTPVKVKPNSKANQKAEIAAVDDILKSFDSLAGAPCYDMDDVRRMSAFAMEGFGRIAGIGIRTQYPDTREYVLKVLEENRGYYNRQHPAWRPVAARIGFLIAEVRLSGN